MLKKQKLLVAGLIFAFVAIVTSVGIFNAKPAAADTQPIQPNGTCPANYTPYPATNPTQCIGSAAPAAPAAGTAANSDDKPTNCAVDKIGWILCPIINSAAELSDKTFQILANNFLNTDAGLVSDDSGTKTAWDIARNIANIMFIVAFLIIIVSQVTNMGINNYGIKKMLPRLIVGAILVNVSYYICQLAVDVTNIFGYEIQNALSGVANSIGPSVFGSVSNYTNGSATPGLNSTTILTAIAAGALAVVGVVWVILAPLGGIILFVLVTVITIVIILLLRKALIVLLIVISPIAFVMYLLPNTERYFKKWMNMFMQLLLVFPTVGLLFGAGQLASTIILVSGAQSTSEAGLAKNCDPTNNTAAGTQAFNKAIAGNPENYDTCGGGSINVTGTKGGGVTCGQQSNGQCTRTVSWMLGLVATGIAVAPLMAVWAVLKGSLSAAGAIGGKISANVQKTTERGAKGAADAYKNSGLGKYRSHKAEERRQEIQAGVYHGRGGRFNQRNLRSRLNKGLNDSDLFNTATGGYGSERRLAAAALNRKDAKEALDMFGGDDDFMKAWAAAGGDEAKMAAIMGGMSGGYNEGRKEKFKQLVGAGHGHKAASYLAAANYLSESGKGSAQDVINATQNAAAHGASRSEVDDAEQAAQVAFRKAGRADSFAAMSTHNGAPMTTEKAFGSISASGLSKDMFGDGPAGDANKQAYANYLASSKDNVEGALRGWTQMDIRTQGKIRDTIKQAATTHGYTGGTVEEIRRNAGMN